MLNCKMYMRRFTLKDKLNIDTETFPSPHTVPAVLGTQRKKGNASYIILITKL